MMSYRIFCTLMLGSFLITSDTRAAAVAGDMDLYSDGCHSSGSSGKIIRERFQQPEDQREEEDPSIPGLMDRSLDSIITERGKWSKYKRASAENEISNIRKSDYEEYESENSLEGQVPTGHADLTELSSEENEEIVVAEESSYHRRDRKQKAKRSMSTADFGKVSLLKDSEDEQTPTRSASETHVKKPHGVKLMAVITEGGSSSHPEEGSVGVAAASVAESSTEDLYHRSVIASIGEGWLKTSSPTNTARSADTGLDNTENNFRLALRFYANLSKRFWREFIKEHGKASLRFDHFHEASWQAEYASLVTSFHMLTQFFLDKSLTLGIHLKTASAEDKRGTSTLIGLLNHWQSNLGNIDRTVLTEIDSLKTASEKLRLGQTWNKVRYDRAYKLFSLFSQKARTFGIGILCSEEVGLTIGFDYICSADEVKVHPALVSVADTAAGAQPALVPKIDIVKAEIDKTADPKVQEYSWLYRHLCCCCINE